jgi:hypothetical protein
MRRFVVFVAALVYAAPALACENAVLVETDELVRWIDRADRALHTGTTREAMRDAALALRVLRGDHEHVLVRLHDRRTRMLAQRAQAVLALAVVRRDGRVDRRRWVPTSAITAQQKDENLRWALGVLEDRARDGRPASLARYAEALARYSERRPIARTILMALADSDLMPDAWGYRVLAELSEEAGDRARRDGAIHACQARAGEQREHICPRLVLAAR